MWELAISLNLGNICVMCVFVCVCERECDVCMWWPEGLISSTQSPVLRGRRAEDKASGDSYLCTPKRIDQEILKRQQMQCFSQKDARYQLLIHNTQRMKNHPKANSCVKAKLKLTQSNQTLLRTSNFFLML